MDYKSTPRPTTSIWGDVQQAMEIAPGIWEVSTAGHGGVLLSSERNKKVPPELIEASFMEQGRSGNYEEDCDISIPMTVFRKEYEEHFKRIPLTEETINKIFERATAEVKRILKGD